MTNTISSTPMIKKYLGLLAFTITILSTRTAITPERSLCEGVQFITSAFNSNKYDLLQSRLVERDSETSVHRGKVRIIDFGDEKVELDFGLTITYTAIYRKTSSDKTIMEGYFTALMGQLQSCLKVNSERDDYADSLEATFTLANGTQILLTAFLSDRQPKYIELEIVKDLN